MRATMTALLALTLVACGGAATPTASLPGPTVSATTGTQATPTSAPTPTPIPTPEPTATPEPTPRPTPTARVTARPTEAARQDLEIVEFGFTGIPGDTSVAQYAVIIENPNPTGWIAARARLRISFFDADGSLLTTEKTYIEAVLLGQTTAVAGPVFEAGEAESMEVLLFQPEWHEIDFTPHRFTFSDVRTRDQQFGGVRTTGRITSEFEDDQEDVQVTVVYRNGQGDVIGGETTYVSVPSMQTASFEVSPLGELDPASEEVYFQLTPRGRPRAP